MKRKPLQTYLIEEELEMLDTLRHALNPGGKPLSRSKAVRQLIRMMYCIFDDKYL